MQSKLKKLIFHLLVLVMTCALFPIDVFPQVADHTQSSNNMQAQSYYSTENPPVFYGAQMIQLGLGQAFDLKDPRFRVFAKDFEDGDLNKHIQIVSNTVNTAVPGTYEIQYFVTDSHGNGANLSVPVLVDASYGNKKTVQRLLYTIPATPNTDRIGYNRAVYHDRQQLGIDMPKGSEITARIVNAQEYGRDLELYMRSDANASSMAVRIPADGSLVSVTNKASSGTDPYADQFISNTVVTRDSVPFFTSPHGVSVQPVVEIEYYDDAVQPLELYVFGDDQDAFFDHWDTSNSKYGVAESERVTLLVPRLDRRSMVHMPTIRNGLSLKFFTNGQRFGFNQLDPFYYKYVCFINTNEVIDTNTEAPHYKAHSIWNNVNKDNSFSLHWDAGTSTLSYTFNSYDNIGDHFTINPQELMGSNSAWLLLSSTAQSSFQMTQFQYEGEAAITDFNTFFGVPIGDYSPTIQNNSISFVRDRCAGVYSRNKMDLSKSFTLSGMLNILNGGDTGLAFTLHNDQKGNRALGSNYRGLGVFGNRSAYSFDTIDELLAYYDDFLDVFDDLSGLELNPTEAYNQNVRTKGFVTASIGGPGMAYYSPALTGQSSATMSGYLSKGWLSLHEFGHGYEGRLGNAGVYLVDVLNNVLSHYYQLTYLLPGEYGWLGEIKKNESFWMNELESYGSLRTVPNYSTRLYFFVNLLNKIGPREGMRAVHTETRRQAEQGIFNESTEIMGKAFTDCSDYNVLPYMNAWGLTVSPNLRAEVYESQKPMLYFLAHIVGIDKAESLLDELGLQGCYDLVSNAEIADLVQTGTLSVNIGIDDINRLIGKTLQLKDGNRIVAEEFINGSSVSFNNIKAGIYEIKLPNPDGLYDFDYYTVLIPEGQSVSKDVRYTRMNSSSLPSSSRIVVNGLSDAEKAYVDYNLSEGTLHVLAHAGAPHVYFSNQYFSIEILDKANQLVFSESRLGATSYERLDVNMPVELGYKIRLYHAEPGRLQIYDKEFLQKPEFTAVNRNKVFEFEVTEFGLKDLYANLSPEANEEQVYARLKNKIELLIQRTRQLIPADKLTDPHSYQHLRNQVLAAIFTLKTTDPDRERYVRENSDFISVPGNKLLYIEEPQTRSIPAGTANTPEALGLPSEVNIITSAGVRQASVFWDFQNSGYNPQLSHGTRFKVKGLVSIPGDIELMINDKTAVQANIVTQSETLYYNDFESGEPGAWTWQQGASVVDEPGHGKVLKLTGVVPNNSNRNVCLDSPDIQNGTLAFDVKFSEIQKWGACIKASVDSNNNITHVFSIDTEPSQRWWEESLTHWSQLPIVRPIEANKWMNFVLVFNGNQYDLYIDEAHYGKFTMSTEGLKPEVSGKLAFRLCNNASMYIDHLQYDKTLAEPTLYYVNFNTQGGTAIPSQGVQVLVADKKATRPEDPVKEGYDFTGWYKDPAYTQPWDFENDKVRDSISLYAKWAKIETYHSVSFNANGGSHLAPVHVVSGQVLSKPTDPSLSHYRFAGWYRDTALTTPWNFETDVVTQDLTLYAKWEAIQYLILFETNGGSSIEPLTAASGTKLPKPLDPTLEGFTFDGWYRDAECTQPWDFETELVSENMILYARWQIIPEEEKPEELPEEKPEELPDGKPEELPEEKPEGLPDGTPEETPGVGQSYKIKGKMTIDFDLDVTPITNDQDPSATRYQFDTQINDIKTEMDNSSEARSRRNQPLPDASKANKVSKAAEPIPVLYDNPCDSSSIVEPNEEKIQQIIEEWESQSINTPINNDVQNIGINQRH